MPQPTSINFWRINRRLQEESRILREAFQKDFQESRKVIARAKETMESIKSPNSLSHRASDRFSRTQNQQARRSIFYQLWSTSQ